MSTELILIHLAFIIGLVYFVFKSGARQGRAEMIEQLIMDKLITPQELIEFYNSEKDKV